VDTLGLVLAVVVHGANRQDNDGAILAFFALKERFRRLRVVFADAAYGRNELPAWVKENFDWVLQTILRPAKAKGFGALPKRRVVERTFGWLMRYRRHSRDDERTPESSELV
jgi:putative transposase